MDLDYFVTECIDFDYFATEYIDFEYFDTCSVSWSGPYHDPGRFGASTAR